LDPILQWLQRYFQNVQSSAHPAQADASAVAPRFPAQTAPQPTIGPLGASGPQLPTPRGSAAELNPITRVTPQSVVGSLLNLTGIPQAGRAGYDVAQQLHDKNYLGAAGSLAAVAPMMIPGGEAAQAFNEVEPEAFHAALSQFAKERPSEAGFITWRTPEEMRAEGMKTYLAPNGQTGYAVHPASGDIRNVFNSGEKGGGAKAVADALANRGGRVLDAFDTNLGNFYRDMGFKESWRSPWNDAYRPATWDAKYGTPDVIGMEHPLAGQASADELLAQYDANRAARKASPVPQRQPQVPSKPTFSPDSVVAQLVGHSLPEQKDLARYVGQRIPQSRVQDVEDAAYKTFSSPAFQQLLKDGNFGDWYNTVRTQGKAVDALGDAEGPTAFEDLMNKMGATTARSSPPNNPRRASYYRALDQADQLDVQGLRTGQYKAVPKGMGHLANDAHHAALADLMENGQLNPITNPKPASFVQNLLTNFRPYTNDTRMVTGTAQVNPGLVDMGAIVKSKSDGADTFSPRNWAYAPMERAAQRAAADAHAAGMLPKVPAGADPTAFWQAKIWDALGPILGGSRSAGTFDDVFDSKLADNAKAWGLSPSQANLVFWKGRPFDLPLDAPLLPKKR